MNLKNNRIAQMIADGTISVEELSEGNELIELAKFAGKAVEACKRTITFKLGEKQITAYDAWDPAGEAHHWAYLTSDGKLTAYCNWGGDHLEGECNITSEKEVFLALVTSNMKYEFRQFLERKIEDAAAIK